MSMLPMRRGRSLLIVGLVSVQLLTLLAACGGTTPAASVPSAAATDQSVRPSNPGGPGAGATLPGNAQTGGAIFASNCVACHAAEGKGGVANAGSTDGTVPPLNPIDATLVNKDPKVFAYNLDLYIQHGSTPGGATPALKMAAWGDTNQLNQQQIADVIAYVISLNPPK